MKKIVIGLICTVVCASALQYSHRIRALGTDFAYLIPDYETDLYRNELLFGKTYAGISYENGLKLLLLTKRFGWHGKYWGSYYSVYNPYDFTRELSISFEDIWMLDMRGHIWKFFEGVWNFYNDGYYRKHEEGFEYISRTTDFAYFLKSQSADSLGKYFTLSTNGGVALYWYKVQDYWLVQVLDELLLVPSLRTGIFYRKSTAPNRFTSWYFDIGGPISTAEIAALPYSLSSHIWGYYDAVVTVITFAHTFVGITGWAKGIPIGDNGFIAIGLRDRFVYQYVQWPDTNATFHAVIDTLALPLAVEYRINTVILRSGVTLIYELTHRKEWDANTVFLKKTTQTLTYKYSFGIGWQPNEHFVIDLLNNADFAHPHDWSIYLKYLF